jgi:NADH:ubiquinone oxidoreductase subunit F (NADH-binding)
MPASSGTEGLSLGYLPGLAPRLVLGAEGREDHAGYIRRDGYRAGGARGEALIAAVEAAGLRGRGGAAFPAGAKLRAVRERMGPRFVVANGEEGEPASIKDRWLLRNRPHLVIDGLLRAAEALAAERAYIYVSDEYAARSAAKALAELGITTVPIELYTVAAAYVAGEETAAVRVINGGPALPLDKPPRPFEEGVGGQPTLVLNVETLANLPLIAVRGATAFREVGHAESAGTFLCTVSGSCERPGLYELPLGIRLRDALALAMDAPGDSRGFLMGGFFAGLLGKEALDARLDYDELRGLGSGLGCGAVVVLGGDDCPVGAAADVMAYFERESSKQCGACIRGTAAMRDVLLALARGTAEAEQIERLRGWSISLRKRGACALLDGAANLAASLVREFPGEIERHLGHRCDDCGKHVPSGLPLETRFRLRLDPLGVKGAST